MNKIEELIEELCPEGVRRGKLEEVLSKIRTGLNPRQNFSLNPPGAKNYYVTVRELAGMKVSWDEKTDRVDDHGLNLIQNRSQLAVGDVLFSATGTVGRMALVSERPNNWNIKEGVYALTPKQKELDSKFLVYLLSSQSIRANILSNTNGSTVQSISMANLVQINIPIPPLQVQKEIVSILDKFTELEAELEAELRCRTRQFEHLREKLFSEAALSQSIELGELCELYSGEFVKKDRQGDHFEFPVYNGGSEPTGYYSDANSPQDSIVIASRGSIGSVSFVKTRFWAGNSCFVLNNPIQGISYRYLYHFLKHSESELYKLRAVGTIPAINLKPLLKFGVPVPELDLQIKISSLLDSFERLQSENSSGLPSEITARRQQYEYYRNKLLTFKELKAS
jgi:type I restriction enzyme S subunit